MVSWCTFASAGRGQEMSRCRFRLTRRLGWLVGCSAFVGVLHGRKMSCLIVSACGHKTLDCALLCIYLCDLFFRDGVADDRDGHAPWFVANC